MPLIPIAYTPIFGLSYMCRERSEAMVLYGYSEFHRKYAYGHLDAHRVIIDLRIGKGLSQKKRATHHRPYV